MKFETENAKKQKTLSDCKLEESVFQVEEESKVCESEDQEIDLEDLLKGSQFDPLEESPPSKGSSKRLRVGSFSKKAMTVELESKQFDLLEQTSPITDV